MELKHTLTFFGLLSDLAGAVLLSIPMIWDTRAAAHTMLKMMKRIRFWLYGYADPVTNTKLIFSRDVQEAHGRIMSVGAFFLSCFAIIGLRLVEIFATARPSSSSPFGASPILIEFMLSVGVVSVILTFYFLGRLPLYIARALIWIARGNHERRIGFVGLGILCIGFVLQATVNLM
jgi:hypothetical protein